MRVVFLTLPPFCLARAWKRSSWLGCNWILAVWPRKAACRSLVLSHFAVMMCVSANFWSAGTRCKGSWDRLSLWMSTSGHCRCIIIEYYQTRPVKLKHPCCVVLLGQGCNSLSLIPHTSIVLVSRKTKLLRFGHKCMLISVLRQSYLRFITSSSPQLHLWKWKSLINLVVLKLYGFFERSFVSDVSHKIALEKWKQKPLR